jgi:DegV family protein with EDD domain
MTVKIVTDSSADLPAQLVKDLGVSVVPLYVRFGEQVYRDRVDITEDQFYERLLRDTVHPSTTQPSPQDFINVYQSLFRGCSGIISIHISSKLSGTTNSAQQAKASVKGLPIEVIDSQVLSMALGLVVISAAKMAQKGSSFKEIVDEVHKLVASVHLMGVLDTLKYVLLGGRIGKAKALLGSLLNVKPVLALKDGEVIPAGQVRSRSKGIDRLLEFARGNGKVSGLSVVHNTTPEDAKILADKIAAANIVDRDKIIISRIGPMLGVHMGPGTLIVAYLD